MSIIAIIPARGGSKRIHKKNIKSFAGHPIIAYTIAAARETNLFDHIIVSTDSEEIAEVARHFGADVPFMRPPELSDDFTETAPVITHALRWYHQQHCCTDYFCCMYATAPFLRPEHIRRGFKLLKKNDATTAFSVTSFPYPIYRALKIDDHGRIRMIWPEYEHCRSNDLPESYHDAGQFYWGKTDAFLKESALFSKDAIPVKLPRYLVYDIDTPEDWQKAEKVFISLKASDPMDK